MTSSQRLVLVAIGALAVAAAFAMANAGVVPIFGLLFAALSPNFWLLGVGVLSFAVLSMYVRRIWVLLALSTLLTAAAGVNTRLPSLLEDALSGATTKMNLVAKLEGEVGQAIHVQSTPSTFGARRNAYAHARPACYGESCLATRGFEAPNAVQDQWTENAADVARSLGFTLAKRGESAPVLTVDMTNQGRFVQISIVLSDEKGAVLSDFQGRYRNSVAGEVPDGIRSDEYSLRLVAEYLLHGNAVAKWAAALVPSSPSHPTTRFLREAVRLTHPQGTELGLRGFSTPGLPAPLATPVELEVLANEEFVPARVFNRKDPGYGTSDWARRNWDSVRDARCRELLVPEVKGEAQMSTWHLFAKDASGRKKVRFTGPGLCDEDAIWLFDFTVEKDRAVVAKYSANGNLAYRASFPKPPFQYGMNGYVLLGTWRSDNGTVTFDWAISSSSGYEERVQSVTTYRFIEPVTR